MDIKEFEYLVKVCAKLNVSEFKFGEAHVIFGEQGTVTRKPSKAMLAKAAQQMRHANLQLQYNDVNESLKVSHVEDPVAYEDALAKGLLIDEETYSSGS